MDVRQVNANLLVALDVLLHERSVTASARRLAVSQPTMSYSLARLRELFGDPLLVRSGAGLALTPLAARLEGELRTAVHALDQVLAVCESFDPRDSQRTFRLAASDGLQMIALGPLMQRVQQLAPGVNLVVYPESRTPFEALQRGDLDICIGANPAPDPRLHTRSLFPQRYVCVAREGHPRIRRRLGLRSFCELPHALVADDEEPGLVDRLLAERGRARRVAVRVPDYAGLGHLVAATDLIATVPEAIAERFAALLPVAVHRPPIAVRGFEVRLFWHPRYDQEPGQRWLRERIMEVAQEVT